MSGQPEIPKMQYAQIFERKGGPIEYKQVLVKEPGPDEVLVNIKYTGVCHTDLHAWKGDWPLESKAPLIGGHEGVGYVVKLSARIDTTYQCGNLVEDIRVGDVVGIKWINDTCLSCEFCMNADEPLCAKALLSGYTVDGTFQQYAIGKANHVARVPPGLDLAAVAPILCAGITVYKALKESGAKPGMTVAITGAGGGLGSLACQYAKAMGLEILAIDTGKDKQDMCLNKLGAAKFVDFATTKNIVADVKAATEGLGPHAVIVVAANEKPFAQAAEYVRSRGTVVCVGLPAGARASADVFSMVTKMIKVCGSYVGNRADTQEALDFFKRGKISAPFKVMGMSQLQEVYKMMEEGKIVGRIVLDTSK
ncbi:chaperonin 10-like protein [Kalaharituber pfeilii]|nr:chaperonin 10-like protein [Kalaharituber pfeilii]